MVEPDNSTFGPSGADLTDGPGDCGAGVLVGFGVAVGFGVLVGAKVGVNVGVLLGVALGDLVPVALAVTVGVGVSVADGMAVAVGVGVSVAVGVEEAVGVGVSVDVGVAVGVLLGSGVLDGVAAGTQSSVLIAAVANVESCSAVDGSMPLPDWASTSFRKACKLLSAVSHCPRSIAFCASSTFPRNSSYRLAL